MNQEVKTEQCLTHAYLTALEARTGPRAVIDMSEATGNEYQARVDDAMKVISLEIPYLIRQARELLIENTNLSKLAEEGSDAKRELDIQKAKCEELRARNLDMVDKFNATTAQNVKLLESNRRLTAENTELHNKRVLGEVREFIDQQERDKPKPITPLPAPKPPRPRGGQEKKHGTAANVRKPTGNPMAQMEWVNKLPPHIQDSPSMTAALLRIAENLSEAIRADLAGGM